MANLLAIYGGVAADSTILNFRSLDVLWNHMLKDGADAVIYWYRCWALLKINKNMKNVITGCVMFCSLFFPDSSP